MAPYQKMVMLALHCLCVFLMAVASHAQPVRVLMGELRVDSTDVLISPYKLEAAVALAFDLADEGTIVPTHIRDSVARAHVTSSTGFTLAQITRLCGASSTVFASCLRVGNLIRAEVVRYSGDSLDRRDYGVGYATIRFRKGADSLLADPAILQAVQRALATMLRRDDIYEKTDPPFNVRPTTLVSVGGIEFTNRAEGDPWGLFTDRITVSYDMAATVVESMIDDSLFTIVDLDTRDSLFKRAGMFYTENYNSTTEDELGVLAAFEVGTVITGTFQRTGKGATLTLRLSSIRRDDLSLVLLREATVPVEADSKLAIRDAVAVAIRNLRAGG